MTTENFRSDGRRHHYVPQLLLNRFATERKKNKFQTYVFDKTKGSVFRTAVENAMLQQDFNAIETGGYRFTYEPSMGKIESDAAIIFDKIVNRQSLADITPAELAIVCSFTALQNLRGPSLRNQFFDLAEGLRERFAEEDCTPEFREQYLELPSEDDQKILAFQMLRDALPKCAEHFAQKDVFLARTTTVHPFILGDTPVTMANDNDYGPYGNIGLAVTGIQIYLPISPLLALGFWCPSIRENAEDSLADLAPQISKWKAVANIAQPRVRDQILANIEALEISRAEAVKISTSIRERIPLDFQPKQVERLNSLQVAFAQRWLVAKTDTFDLPRRMITEEPKFMGRRKPQF